MQVWQSFVIVSKHYFTNIAISVFHQHILARAHQMDFRPQLVVGIRGVNRKSHFDDGKQVSKLK